MIPVLEHIIREIRALSQYFTKKENADYVMSITVHNSTGIAPHRIFVKLGVSTLAISKK